jgi:8-oxo-dGTP pyrophosphatase MutT (NUDIX family)
MAVAALRPAATVVVLREDREPAEFEVLLLRRNDKVAFMAGAYVFPGGRVDDSDQPTDAADRFRVAAVRELREEAQVVVDAADLVPFAHWVTPEIEIRRFDTHFFLARMPAGQEARHDEGETTALAWLTPAAAIERARQRDIMLPPPTWTTLKRLSRFSSIGDVFDWARNTRIVRVQPNLIRDEQRTMLTLPGDPTYPTIEGWEVPEDTRFVLQDGQWLPTTP